MEYPDSTLLQVTILSHKVKKKKKKDQCIPKEKRRQTKRNKTVLVFH